MRRKVLYITGDLVAALMLNGIHGAYEITEGIPPNAKLVGVSHQGHMIALILESDDFPSVLISKEPIPTVQPVVSTVNSAILAAYEKRMPAEAPEQIAEETKAI